MSRIAIIGAGAWGTGLAIVLGRNRTHHVPHNVRLWANEPEVTESIARNRICEAKLKFLLALLLLIVLIGGSAAAWMWWEFRASSRS